ncbi:hypothetical protein V2W45_1450980 [Cenococcum geophilum]
MSKPSGLQQDMCSLVRPGALRSDIDEETIASNLPPELRYACRYWVHHLEQSQQQLNNGDLVHLFLQKHLLHWLEAMSLIKETNKCVRLLERLQSLTNSPTNTISSFLRDAKRFVLRFQVLADAPTDLFFGACFCARDEHYPTDFRRPSSGVDWDAIQERSRLEPLLQHARGSFQCNQCRRLLTRWAVSRIGI